MGLKATRTCHVLLGYLSLIQQKDKDFISLENVVRDFKDLETDFVMVYRISSAQPDPPREMRKDIHYLSFLGLIDYDDSKERVRITAFGNYFANLLELPPGIEEPIRMKYQV